MQGDQVIHDLNVARTEIHIESDIVIEGQFIDQVHCFDLSTRKAGHFFKPLCGFDEPTDVDDGCLAACRLNTGNE